MSASFISYLREDILRDISGLSYRPMFGAIGIYKDDCFIGIAEDDMVYLKVDETNQTDYEEKGSSPFLYYRNNKPTSLSFWYVPEDILENKAEIAVWIEKSAVIARRQKQTKGAKTHV